ncbi:hypothetical protein Naga_100594g4 [Nannochloropsis gaditana]|uniref:Uncharacterized protein n=1 Tax=Nannochloropsis gaditana TaxID=72520 RepID=W7TJ21_9STRA|nr:hypothetical protein Naga_100594g4 [Nannochloropsis gaditana]
MHKGRLIAWPVPAMMVGTTKKTSASRACPSTLTPAFSRYAALRFLARRTGTGIVFFTVEDRAYAAFEPQSENILCREKAAPLWEDPQLMTAEALNEIFAPDEKENIMLLRSMWTASCIFRLDGIFVDSLDLQARVWEQVAEGISGTPPSLPPSFPPSLLPGPHLARASAR